MGGKTVIIFAASAVVLLGLCSVAMSRLGESDRKIGSQTPAGVSQPKKELLKPTATFNVSEKTAEGINVLPQTVGIVDRLNDPESSAEDDLSTVDELIRIHMGAFKSVPQGGENAEIVQRMTGVNERGLAVIPPGHESLNDRGELVDRWGTPYHFHPVSSKVLEIRSAGPDGHLWTEDDILMDDLE